MAESADQRHNNRVVRKATIVLGDAVAGPAEEHDGAAGAHAAHHHGRVPSLQGTSPAKQTNGINPLSHLVFRKLMAHHGRVPGLKVRPAGEIPLMLSVSVTSRLGNFQAAGHTTRAATQAPCRQRRRQRLPGRPCDSDCCSLLHASDAGSDAESGCFVSAGRGAVGRRDSNGGH